MNKLIVIKKSTLTQSWIAVLVCAVMGISSCKENTVLPPDLVPAVDNINTFQQDTFSVLSHTTIKDSLLTGGKLNSTDRGADANFSHAIGTIINGTTGDNVFGKTIASVYVQVRPPSPNFSFSGSNQIIDSIILAMNYLGAYGDTTTALNQIFEVHRSPDDLSKDDAYYESSTATHSLSTILTTDTPKFNTIGTDSPVVAGVKLRPQLRIRLPLSFENDLLAQTAIGAFKDYPAFLSWLGGFYITPDSNMGNTLGYFDTDNTTMYVYYRFTDPDPDTAVAVFPFDPAYCNRFNNITRNYNGAPANNFINTGATQGDAEVFVQGESGLAGLISFPNIGKFPNAIINKAELIFTVISPYNNFADTSTFNIPDQLQLTYVNSDGDDDLLPDYTIFGTSVNAIGAAIQRVGALRDWSSGQQYIQYKCNITRTIQDAVTMQNSNFAIKISGASGNFPARTRVVIGGSASLVTLEKPKLNIIFTKIQ